MLVRGGVGSFELTEVIFPVFLLLAYAKRWVLPSTQGIYCSWEMERRVFIAFVPEGHFGASVSCSDSQPYPHIRITQEFKKIALMSKAPDQLSLGLWDCTISISFFL